MGTWGVGAFENDGVSDWVWELEKANDLEVLRQALEPESGYLEAPDGEILIAAAEVLAAALRAPGQGLPEGVVGWLALHPQLNFAELLPQARQGLARVLSQDSELVELWEESDEAGDWRRNVEDLVGRLARV